MVWTFREAWHHHLALQVPRRLGLSPGAIANPGEDVVRDAERTAKLSSARPVNTLPLTKTLGGHRLLLCVVAGSGSVGEGRYRLCEGAAKNAEDAPWRPSTSVPTLRRLWPLCLG